VKKPSLEKHVLKVSVADHLFEVDEFTGPNTGLIIAEVELSQKMRNS